MPFNKKGNIAKGNPDKRKNIRPVKHGSEIGHATRFKKGHVPKNKLLRTILKEKGFDRETINKIFAEILISNPKTIAEVKMDEETTMLELIGISGVEAAVRSADFGRCEWLLGQIFGKEVQRTETVNYNMNASLDPKTSEEDAEIIKRALERSSGNSRKD